MGQEYGIDSVGVTADQLQDQIEALYLDDYLVTWQRYFDSLDIVPMNNPRETVVVLRELSSKDSPMIALVKSISEHTSAKAFSLLSGVVDQAGGVPEVVQAASDQVGRDVPSAVTGSGDLPSSNRVNPVVEYFAELNALVEAEGDNPLPIDETISKLNNLYVHMSAKNNSIRQGKDAIEDLISGGAAKAVQDMDLLADRQPKPISTLLDKVSNKAKLQTSSDANNYMKRQWETEVARHCKNMIQGRYPFNRNSSREATFDDVTAYFGPGGILETFFDGNVASLIDTSRRPWKWNEAPGIEVGFSEGALRQLENGRVIRDTFYRTGSTEPSISFELKPIKMDKSILRMSLFVNGQQLAYAHGPQTGKRFRWPDLSRNSERGIARLVIVTTAGQESITEQGDWALFRLFDKATVKRLDRERYELTFKLKNQFELTLELRAGSVYNPFQMAELRQVRCE
jgi:type VI secretion system protein ImpL